MIPVQMTNLVAEVRKAQGHLAICLMLVPQLFMVVLNVMHRHVVPRETELKCDVKNASHTQKIFFISDN